MTPSLFQHDPRNASPDTAGGNGSGDATALLGRWAPVTAAMAGQAWPDALLKTISLTRTAHAYEVTVGAMADRGTWTIDAAATPKAMTITGTEGPNQGKTLPCIYELAGDTLRVCYDLSGTARPTAFESTARTTLYLVSYQRQPV
jgi:uncharacterized protein (TIGR03067 family)